MTTPAELYRNAIDLNRFSNSVAKRIARTYNDLILDAVDQLRGIDELAAPVKAARLRAILAQLKGSLDNWAEASTLLAVEELQGLAVLQSEFVTSELAKALPAELADQIKSVQISPQFAQAVATVDPTALNVVTLSDDLQAAVTGAPQAFRLTAAQGSVITLPNGKVLEKSFRGLAESQADLFSMTVRNGLLTGESTDKLARRLKGRLRFGQPAMSLRQMAQAGGEVTAVANHQVMALMRTSINQVANASSQQVYEANQDVTKKYRYVATLDSRTSPICRSLDGKEFVYGKGPVPPQHFNCRSTTVPIIDYKSLGFDPPPLNSRRRPGTTLGPSRGVRGGTVPDTQTYGQWLELQSKAVKDDVLGASKVPYFESLVKKVGPTKAIRKFVSQDGSELTLAQLRRRYPDVKAAQ
jgi:SPP1 gp7 family putative phage head morphogenesis protein